jgi:hypothetical protein
MERKEIMARMTKREQENWWRTLNRLAELGIRFQAADQLRRLSNRWNRLAEGACSVDDWRQNPYKGAESWYDYRQNLAERQARALLPEGVELYVQGDCRGLSFYVCGPDVRRPLDQHYPDGIGL